MTPIGPTDDPVPARGTRTRASKKRKATRKEAAVERARRRYLITKFALERAALSYSQRLARVKAAIEEGELPGPAPSRSSLYRWCRKAEEKDGEINLYDFFDRPRSGRPTKPFDPKVRDYLTERLLLQEFSSLNQLLRDAEEYAAAEGLEAPTYAMVRRFVYSFDPAEEEAARSGSRAAVTRAMPKSTVPADEPHQIWTLDEMCLPVWMRAYHPHDRQWVAVKPWVVLVADNYSRAILSYLLVPPYEQGAKISYTADHILATLLSAALPELAPEETAPYAGYLPEVLRWDKHSTHKNLRGDLRQNGIQVPQLPGLEPHRRGSIERLVSTLKDFCTPIPGAAAHTEPIGPQLTEDPKKRRTRAAAGGGTRRAKKEVAVGDLLRYEDLVAELGKRVRAYNEEHEHRMLGTTPDVAYHRKLEKKNARNGRDAVLLIEGRMLTCTKAGIEFRDTRFAWESGGQELQLRQQVHCRPDPLLRGMFVETDDGRTLFLETLEEWAKKADDVAVSRAQRRKAREASDRAAAARRRKVEEDFGPGAPERAEHELEKQLGEKRAESRKEDEEDEESGEDDRKVRVLPVSKEEDEEDQEGDRPLPRGLAGDPRDRIRRAGK